MIRLLRNWLRHREDVTSEKLVGNTSDDEKKMERSTALQRFWSQPKEKTADSFIEHYDNDLGKALYFAVPSSPEVAAELLRRGARINYRGIGGLTAVHKCWGPRQEAEACLKLLLNAGADINGQKDDGETALYIRSEDLNVEMVRCFLENGADPNIPEINGQTALHAAARNSQIHCNPPMNDSAMFYLAIWEDPEVVETCRILLDAGASIDARDNFGNTPLMEAAASLNLQAVKLVLARGADPMLVDNEGESAADAAAHAYELSLQDEYDSPYYVIRDESELAAAREAVRRVIVEAQARWTM